MTQLLSEYLPLVIFLAVALGFHRRLGEGSKVRFAVGKIFGAVGGDPGLERLGIGLGAGQFLLLKHLPDRIPIALGRRLSSSSQTGCRSRTNTKAKSGNR